MINLRARSGTKELLDADDVPFEAIKKNMQELNRINSLLGGHAITINGFKQLLGSRKKITVCEIGCGGGDNLKAIEKYCNRHKIDCSFIGVDIKAECLEFARQQYPEMNCTWICSDYRETVFTEPPDIIFSSLFCHHFDEIELVEMLKWKSSNSTIGFFINDLHRHVLAYYSIKWLTAAFSSSYMVKHDAPVSVTRGFLRTDWKMLLAKAGVNSASVQWKWAFRHLVIHQHAN